VPRYSAKNCYGGRLGTQLLQMGVIDEATLGGASLPGKLGCEGIILGGMEITRIVIQN